MWRNICFVFFFFLSLNIRASFAACCLAFTSSFLYFLQSSPTDKQLNSERHSQLAEIENKFILNNLSLKLINGKCVMCLSKQEDKCQRTTNTQFFSIIVSVLNNKLYCFVSYCDILFFSLFLFFFFLMQYFYKNSPPKHKHSISLFK